MEIYEIPQIDGIRIVAISARDAVCVDRDPAMIDCCTPVGCLDLYSDGTRVWGRAGTDTRAGRAAILAHLADTEAAERALRWADD